MARGAGTLRAHGVVALGDLRIAAYEISNGTRIFGSRDQGATWEFITNLAGRTTGIIGNGRAVVVFGGGTCPGPPGPSTARPGRCRTRAGRSATARRRRSCRTGRCWWRRTCWSARPPMTGRPGSRVRCGGDAHGAADSAAVTRGGVDPSCPTKPQPRFIDDWCNPTRMAKYGSVEHSHEPSEDKTMKYFISVVILATGSPAYAYKIGVLGSSPIHESITAEAESCLRALEAAGVNPMSTHCPLPDESLGKATAVRDLGPQAARWADTPGRRTGLHFIAHFTGPCEHQLARDGLRSEAGVTCEGHYGRLQFWHAQEPMFVGAPPSDPDAATLSLMLGWADVVHDLVTGVTPLDEPIAAEEPSLNHQLQAAWHGGTPLSARELFALDCRNRGLRARSCRRAKVDDAGIRRLALGSLLHIVQDSYATGHVHRGAQGMNTADRQRFYPEVRCQPVRGFTDYSNQDSTQHGKGDTWPIFVDCGEDAVVDDVITATMRVIHLVSEDDGGALRTYLAERVWVGL